MVGRDPIGAKEFEGDGPVRSDDDGGRDRENGNRLTIVGLGEVLFDVFEDGTQTLGGAPLNVAVHAHQLAAPLVGGEGVVASRVGCDARGSEILELLKAWGMATRYVQEDREHPTGVVSVFMNNGEPGYQVEAGAAWDYISASQGLDELAVRCDAVCFGSLAQRASSSRQTIQRFLQQAPQALRLFDINLRRNTLTHEAAYSAELIEETCRLATMIKLNEAELAEVCGWYGVNPSIENLLKRFPVEGVILTRGEQGTTLFTHRGVYSGRERAAPVGDAHPVGAGDACSAGILFGLLLGWQPDEAVDLANRMGAWVVSQLSATPRLPDEILTFVQKTIKAHLEV
jgi:fructokinase